MSLDDLYNDLPEDCRKLNIKLFFLYTKAQLSKEQERFIDVHCGKCDHCRANLAYVYEIVKGSERLSTDGQTLLLKYLHDPIFRDTIEKFKNNIREEILAEVKHLINDNLKDASLNIVKIGSSVADDSNHLDKAISNPSQISIPNTFNKIINEITNIKPNYSYFVSAFLVVLLFTLSILSYLAINSKPNQNLDNANISSFSQQDKQVTTNLYQDLDTAINQYLESKTTDDLNKANLIAKTIEDKYGDKYGVDLVNFYHSVPETAIEQLDNCRKRFAKLQAMPKADNYQQRLELAESLINEFYLLGDLAESFKVKLFLAKCLLKTYKYTELSSLLNTSLSFTKEHNYSMLEGYFLLWKGKYLSLTDTFTNTEIVFRDALNIGKIINSDDLVINAGNCLSALYHTNNEDQKALEITQVLLAKTQENNELFIGLNQIAGLSAFNLGFHTLSESYLNSAIKRAEEINNPYLIATSWAFLGVTLAENKNFQLSEMAYLNSNKAIDQIKEQHSKLDALSIVLGYQAKANLLAGNFEKAANLYKETLSSIKELGIRNNLEMAQLNEALAIAVKNLGKDSEAQEYTTIANNYKKLSTDKNETSNCLLSFLPANCH